MTEAAEQAPAPVLTEAVRRRVVGYAAEAIRQLQPNQVPPVLRAAMRWRSGAMPRGFAERVMEELAVDHAFRERVASRLTSSDSLAMAVVEGRADPASDPVAVASVLYLARPDGWAQQLDTVVAALVAPADPSQELRDALAQVEDLRAKLAREQERHERDVAAARRGDEQARAALAESASRLREQLASMKQELEQARAECEKSQREVAELTRSVRSLRAQVTQAKSETGQQRAEQRDARLAATARAKVLLEVLQEAAAGLAAEVALPAGVPAPADLVEAVAPADPVARRRLHTASDVALVLAAPRCHLIVDGYNVSKGMWPNSALSQQRDRLITALTALQSRTGAEITVVFDGAEVGGVPAVTSRSVRVRFSAAGEKADRVIVRLVEAEPVGRPVVVISSDAALTSGARNEGARTADSEVLRALLGPSR